MAEKRNTIQKEVISRIICNSCSHPIAEQIYIEAKQEIPNLSLGTVYRVLKELENEGKIFEITMRDEPSHFDKVSFKHAHLFCKKCKKIVDIEYKNDLNSFFNFDNCIIDTVDIVLKGTCPNCK